jgi:hypothetical protein
MGVGGRFGAHLTNEARNVPWIQRIVLKGHGLIAEVYFIKNLVVDSFKIFEMDFVHRNAAYLLPPRRPAFRSILPEYAMVQGK